MSAFAFSPPLDQSLVANGVTSPPWMGFFTSVSVEKKQWTPTLSGVTSTGVAGTWTRFGPSVRLFVSLTGSASAGGSLTLPFRCVDAASAQFWNADTKTLVGSGFITGNTLFFPNWTTANVVLFGEYMLENK